MTRERLIAGCMTGTSIDGIDAALVRIRGEGLSMTSEIVKTASRSLDVAFAPALRAFARLKPATSEQVANAALKLGVEHARLLSDLLGDVRADLVSVHGQTVFHHGHDDARGPRLTWQMINPWPIVSEVRVPVVCDLRWADLAAGGTGAPITPLSDWIMFRDTARRRIIVNLGGFANFTWLGTGGVEDVKGWDICVCNQWLDNAAERELGKPFDPDGVAALAGTPDASAERSMREHLLRQARGGRSLGTDDEGHRLVDRLREHRNLNGPNLLRSICAAMGEAITEAVMVTGTADELILAGGGAHNKALVLEIERAASSHGIGRVLLSDELGVGVGYREAAAMAVLGALAQDGIPLTLPAVTGRRAEVGRFGCWVYP